ncbi:hypothetical protein [Nocardia sp. XZ_19_385]|uniref:hypothetical protein n=1 Tax=Nocardia sp. XZ_19_385 TaxID=2769488 RepID=UPI00188EF8DF|nr:hypothetical protein [Nocardia sp. XZ_19_385]
MKITAKPDAAEVVALGGWHPRYARVLVVAGNGVRALALVDTNSDGVEINADELSKDEHGHWGSSSGPVPNRRAAGPFGYRSDEEGLFCAYGRAEATGTVVVQVDGQGIEVVANDDGWWAWIRAAKESANDESVPKRSGRER